MSQSQHVVTPCGPYCRLCGRRLVDEADLVVEELKAKIGQLESEIVVLRGELSGSECDVAFWKERATAVDKENLKVKETEGKP